METTINLCRLIIIDDISNIDDKGLSKLLSELYQQLKDNIGFYYRDQTTSKEFTESELLELIDGGSLYPKDRIKRLFSSKNLFNINGLFSIPIAEVILRLVSFDFENNSLVLHIYAISTDVKLITTVADHIIVRLLDQQQSSYQNTTSIKLAPDLFIAKI